MVLSGHLMKQERGREGNFFLSLFFWEGTFKMPLSVRKLMRKNNYNIQKCLVPSNQWCKIFHVLFVSLRFTLHEKVTVKEILWWKCSHPLEDCERLMLSLCWDVCMCLCVDSFSDQFNSSNSLSHSIALNIYPMKVKPELDSSWF